MRPPTPAPSPAPRTRTIRPSLRGWLALGLLALAGCSGRNTFLTGGATAGQMKTTLSHLEFENEQLRTEVAKLKQENRSMEDRLAAEQIHNGDLAARLDDARNLLRDRGVDWDARLSDRARPPRSGEPEDEQRPARTLPAGRTTRKPRKPPAASIPGDLEDLPTASDDEPAGDDTISFRAGPLRPRSAGGRASSLPEDDQYDWQPIARGTASPSQAPPRR